MIVIGFEHSKSSQKTVGLSDSHCVIFAYLFHSSVIGAFYVLSVLLLMSAIT